MGHLNVQGIQNKIEQIDLLLNSSGDDIHLFGLSESKLNDSHTSNFFNVKNFQLFRKDRDISAVRPEQGGGIIVYVKDGIKCERRFDLERENIECIWLEIFPKNSKSFWIGSMYRHPNETVQWNEIFDNQFDKILACEKEIYLMETLIATYCRSIQRKLRLNIWNHLALNKLLCLQLELQIIQKH